MKKFPNSVAIVAIVLAALLVGGGTAVAAGKYIITSKSQIKPSVVKQLKGHDRQDRRHRGHRRHRGRPAPRGPTGAAGATGPQGPRTGSARGWGRVQGDGALTRVLGQRRRQPGGDGHLLRPGHQRGERQRGAARDRGLHRRTRRRLGGRSPTSSSTPSGDATCNASGSFTVYTRYFNIAGNTSALTDQSFAFMVP